MEEEEIDFCTSRDAPLEYVLSPVVKVWVNKAQILADAKEGDIKHSVLAERGLGWVEAMVTGAVEERTADEDLEFESRIVIVKSLAGRGINNTQIMDDFGDLTIFYLFHTPSTLSLPYLKPLPLCITHRHCHGRHAQAPARGDVTQIH
jgi:DNA/RNA endonuclease YhcR with UshA esterase domain